MPDDGPAMRARRRDTARLLRGEGIHYTSPVSGRTCAACAADLPAAGAAHPVVDPEAWYDGKPGDTWVCADARGCDQRAKAGWLASAAEFPAGTPGRELMALIGAAFTPERLAITARPAWDGWHRIDLACPRWVIIRTLAGGDGGVLYQVSDAVIATYGRAHVERMLAHLPPLPAQAWQAGPPHRVERL